MLTIIADTAVVLLQFGAIERLHSNIAVEEVRVAAMFADVRVDGVRQKLNGIYDT